MVWDAHLALHYRRDDARTVVRPAHRGPLRALGSLYPEGPGICHNVMLHPPGGVVPGDRLQIDVALGAGCHALITTPGATRFYRSDGRPAAQQATLRLEAGSRLEWLPLETIAYSGCKARNGVALALDPGAEMLGWDVLALGLPAADQPFAAGRFRQEIDLPGVWLERARIDAADTRLLRSPLGWAGRGVSATLWFATGTPLAATRRTALLDEARGCIEASSLASTAGATSPDARVVLVRALADRVEPLMALYQRVWSGWRRVAWELGAPPPRIWRT